MATSQQKICCQSHTLSLCCVLQTNPHLPSVVTLKKIKMQFHFFKVCTRDSQTVHYLNSVRSRSPHCSLDSWWTFGTANKEVAIQWLLFHTSFWQCPSTQLIHLKGPSDYHLWQSLRLSSARAVAWTYRKGRKGREKKTLEKNVDPRGLWIHKLLHALFGCSSFIASRCFVLKINSDAVRFHQSINKYFAMHKTFNKDLSSLLGPVYVGVYMVLVEFNPSHIASITMVSHGLSRSKNAYHEICRKHVI